jgi:hypothetical protein
MSKISDKETLLFMKMRKTNFLKYPSNEIIINEVMVTASVCFWEPGRILLLSVTELGIIKWFSFRFY